MDASASDTITSSGGAVSQWDDLSGNDNHATQGTGSDQPVTDSDVLNNLNAISFTSDYFNFTPTISSVKSLIFVADKLNGSDISAELSPIVGEVTTSQNHTFVRTNTDDYDISIDGSISNTGNASVNGGSLVSGGNIDVGISQSEKDDANIWYVDYDSAVNVNYLGLLATSNTYKLIGSISEVVLLDSVPTTSDRQKIEGYLAHKWGLEGNLPSDHPYKTQKPTV